MVDVNRREFTRAIERCARVSLQKSPLEVLSHALVECSEGTLRYRATDLKVEVSGSVEAKGKARFTAKPRDLLNALAALAGETVKLEPGAGFVKLSGDTKRSFKVQTLEADDYPAEIEVGGEQFEVEGSLIGRLMSMVVHAASEDEARQNQKRVFIAKRDVSVAMATDGHRMAICSAELALPKELDIPLTLAQELADIDEGVMKLSTDERGIAYERGNERTIALVQAGQFPNVMPILDGLKPAHRAKLSAESLLDMVKAVRRIDSVSGVCLTFSKSGIAVECTGEGSARDELDCESTGDGQLWFEGLYLVEALSVVKGDVVVKFGATLEPLIVEQANWKSIIMPMHPDHAKSKGK